MAGDLRSQILAIQEDASLDDAQKAVKRQALLSGKWQPPPVASPSPGANLGPSDNEKTRTGHSWQCMQLIFTIGIAARRSQLRRHSPGDVRSRRSVPDSSRDTVALHGAVPM